MTSKTASKNIINNQVDNDLRVEFRRDKNGITIINRHQGGHTSCSNMFWMTGWTFATAILFAYLLIDPALLTVCIAIPFLSAWAFAYCNLAWQFVGREEFVLSLDRAEIKRFCVFKIAHKTIATREVTLFRQRIYCPALTDHHTSVIAIDIETLGTPIACLHNLTEYDANFIGNSLNEFLRQDCATQWTNRSESKTPGKSFTKLPSHSNRFRFDFGFTGVNFSRRGSMDWARLRDLVFFNGFWNGCGLFFVLSQIGLIETGTERTSIDWWMGTLILAPHAIVGLCALTKLISVMMRPLIVTQWSIEKPVISKRTSIFGVAVQNRSFDLQVKSRFRIRRMQQSKGSFFANQKDRPALREVVLLNSDKQEYCAISHLTEAEATEVATQLECYCRGWVTM